MALTYSEPVKLGMAAPEFSLPGTESVIHHLTDFRYARALVVVFMCNHCPYVQAVLERVNELAKEYRNRGVQLIGINSNDSVRYPADSLENMRKEVAEKGLDFPYLFDETQEIARAYGAVCTPDFFVFEQVRPEVFREADEESAKDHYRDAFLLRYRGRLDDNWKDPAAVTQRDLRLALEDLLAGRKVAAEQYPSLGCSIKWKLGAA